MSGGSMDYVYLHIKKAAGLTEDETIAHLLIDLSKVLHDEEWADCCDISYEEYQDTLLKFKRKWLEQEPKTEWIPVHKVLPWESGKIIVPLPKPKTGHWIEIPKGATNGDMIKAVFPNAQIWQEGEWIYMGHKYMGCPQVDMEDDWWNSPYRKEQE